MMQKHIKTYLDHFGFRIQEDCFCEIPKCGVPAQDIHHIIPRSKFGSKRKDEQDDIKNLMALYRKHHDDAHAEKLSNEYLKGVHQIFIHGHNDILVPGKK